MNDSNYQQQIFGAEIQYEFPHFLVEFFWKKVAFIYLNEV